MINRILFIFAPVMAWIRKYFVELCLIAIVALSFVIILVFSANDRGFTGVSPLSENSKMKATDVRIGNLVMYDGRVFEMDVVAKEFPSLNTIEFGLGVVDWEDIQPVKLTEEWLYHFGGKRVSYVGLIRYQIGTFQLKQLKQHEQGYYLIDRMGGRLSNILEYVHQLQNLYFVLMGEELTAK